MAGNQSRVVELQIKLAGAQSIKDLEEVTSEINTELKQISTTSKSFTAMGDLAKKANSKVKEINESLGGITSAEKAEAVNKMGMALVGAFQAAAGASLLFGEKTGKALEGAIKQVGGLFAITDGLKKVTEAFSAKNLAALKASVKGWQESGLAAKLFGGTVSKALIATGLGAFIVLLGVIIANWDKIKTAGKAAMDGIMKSSSVLLAPLKAIIGFVQGLIDKFGSLGNLLKSVGAFFGSVFRGEGIAAANKALEDTAKKLLAIDAATKLYNEELKTGKQTLEDTNAVLEAQGNQQDKIFTNQINHNKKLIQDLEEIVKLGGELTEEQEKQLHDSQQAVKVDEIRLANYKKETAEKSKQKALDEARKKIEEARAKAELERGILQKGIAIQMANVNQEIVDILETEALRMDEIDEVAGDINKTLQSKYDVIQKTNDLLDYAVNNQGLQLKNIEDYINKLDKLTTKANNIKPPTGDAEALVEILHRTTNEYAKQRDLINEANDFIKSYTNENTKDKGIVLDINEAEMQRIVQLEGQKKALQAQNDIRIGEINAEKLRNNEARQYSIELKVQQAIKLALFESSQKEILSEISKLDALDKSKLTQIELLQLQSRGFDLLQQYQGVTSDIHDLGIEMDATTKSMNDGLAANLKLNEEALNINQNIVEVEKQQGEIIADNAQIYLTKFQKAAIKVGNFFKKNGKDIMDSLDEFNNAIGQVGELLAAQDERKAEMAQRELDRFQEEEGKKLEIELKHQQDLADAQEKIKSDLADKEKDLNDLLADAEGERYDDIKQQILDNQAAQQTAQLAKDAADKESARLQAVYDFGKLQRVYDVEKAEYNAAKHKKTASIIQGIIDTALAVIKALPNVFLSVAAGIAGAASVAVIATQPLPPAPIPPVKPAGFKKGGFTGEGARDKVAGVVHAGEYVVPQSIVRNPVAQGMLSSLEGMRMRGYAQGGSVVPTAASADNAFDYVRIGDEVARALKANPMFVSWQEWKETDTKVKVIQSRGGFGR